MLARGSQRVQDLRDAVWQEYEVRIDGLWWRQQQAWKAAIQRTKERDRTIRAYIRAKYKHKWRNLYYNQRKEFRHVERISGNVFERAVYVFTHRRTLGSFDKPLTRRQMLALITSGERLKRRVAAIHRRDREGLARQSKLEARSLTEPLWAMHKRNMDFMKAQQTRERRTLRRERDAAKKSMSFEVAKQSLAAEQDNAPREFRVAEHQAGIAHRFYQSSALADHMQADEAERSRAAQIKRDMQAWRRRNEGREFGREL